MKTSTVYNIFRGNLSFSKHLLHHRRTLASSSKLRPDLLLTPNKHKHRLLVLLRRTNASRSPVPAPVHELPAPPGDNCTLPLLTCFSRAFTNNGISLCLPFRESGVIHLTNIWELKITAMFLRICKKSSQWNKRPKNTLSRPSLLFSEEINQVLFKISGLFVLQ